MNVPGQDMIKVPRSASFQVLIVIQLCPACCMLQIGICNRALETQCTIVHVGATIVIVRTPIRIAASLTIPRSKILFMDC
jgi:hypothetical protein